MSLSDTVQDARLQMVEQIQSTFQELERHIEVIDRLQTACARSHRCWPSRVSWGVMVGLLTLDWFLVYDRAQEDRKRAEALSATMMEWKETLATSIPPHGHPERRRHMMVPTGKLP